MTEVEDWVRTTNQTEKRKLETEICKLKDESFHMNESANKHEHFVAQEMRDLQDMMQETDRKLKVQMCEMEQRLKERLLKEEEQEDSEKTIDGTENPMFLREKPQFSELPPSANISVVGSEESGPGYGDPVFQSTPLEKEARKAFPSKIRPPGGESTPKVLNPMVKALKKCNVLRGNDQKSGDAQVCGDTSLLECEKSEYVKLPEIK